jgi:archaellum biogenesis protein FlaJ (TadC family)
MKAFLLLSALLLVLLVAGLTGASAAPVRLVGGPIAITPVNPAPNSTINSETPTIEVTFTDSSGTISAEGVSMIVNRVNVTGFDEVTITSHSIAYAVPSVLPLVEGVNNVTVRIQDLDGNSAALNWSFAVNTSLVIAPPTHTVSPQTVLVYTGIGAGVAAAAFGGWILYLKQTTRFAFRKYFITHPVQRAYVVLYVPFAVAFVLFLVGLAYVTGNPGLPAMAPDYVVLGAILIGITPFGIDSQRELTRIRAYERAFAQFLFEMADAMRGGIDPAKAVVELSKTNANILRRHLRIAADGIRMGRPFEVVLREMVSPIRSPLVKRYAGLIADATGVGGETALVVYRAAKDMDDFVKIEEERAKQLTLPVAVIYIAFAVLLAVLFSLLYIAPTLGSLNIGFVGGGGNPLASAGTSNTSTVPKLDVGSLHERFYELMLINSLGTGAIIGAFTEGRARYGILHSVGLAVATTIAFTLFVV